jgi:hypothetical protein
MAAPLLFNIYFQFVFARELYRQTGGNASTNVKLSLLIIKSFLHAFFR